MIDGDAQRGVGNVGAGRLVVPDERWEQGSDFHLTFETGGTVLPWSLLPHTLWGSGRDALRALVAWGRSVHRWRRILVPTYYCHEVIEPLFGELEVSSYEHAPTSPATSPVDASNGDVVLVVALFGMPPAPAVAGRAVVIEDHTHDPLSSWSADSRADYAFASLRKTLPLPDGGVLWSPRGLDIAPERPVTLDHDRAAFQRLWAMTLKRHYLGGGQVTKEEFRSLAIDGERGMSQGDISGISSFSLSRLPTMPAASWRSARAVNLRAFRAALGELPAVTVLDAPFAATLVFDTPRLRDRVRDSLIAARIYPSVLWSLDEPGVSGVPASHVELARCILSIHCDYRYDPADMARVARAIRNVLGAL